jgi:hypothetical protein
MDELESTLIRDRYSEIDREFWERKDYKNSDSGSEYRLIYEALIPKVRAKALEEDLDDWLYKEKLRKASDIIDDIAYALKSNWNDAPDDRIWFYPTDLCLSERPEEWTDASPISSSMLDAATARYLKEPWMQLNRIDWYILNGFIYDELARLSDGIKTGLAVGDTNWAYIFSGGSRGKTLIWQISFALIKFIFRWLLLPAVAAIGYYFGYTMFAKWVMIIFGVYIAVYILMFPGRYIQGRKKRKQYSDLLEEFKKMFQIWQCSNVTTLNPTRLKEQIANFEKVEIYFKPAVYSILDKAIERDPSVFTLD